MSAFLLAVTLATAAQAAGAQESDAWTLSNLDAFVNAVVPVPEVSAQELKAEWAVSARALPAFDGPLATFVVFKDHGGEIHGNLTVVSDPLAPQLQALHAAFPDATPSELAAKAQATRLSFLGRTCPGLKRAARDFERLRISALPQNFLTVDPATYEFRVSTYWGQPRVYYALEPPGTSWGRLGAYPDPLIVWFRTVQTAL